jgi:hypothetical protein
MTKPVDRERLVSVLRGICNTSERRILLVDDDEIMRESLRRALEQEHWTVAEAANGRVALERLAELRPDVIMLDLMMPEMDGFEFLAAMRKHVDWQDIPVLVVTAKDLNAQEHARLQGDVERIMQKNASELDELLRELGKVLPRSIERGHQTKVREVLA